MNQPLPVDAIAVRLADEGVPLRAIARATNTPSNLLRSKLHAAHSDGRLVDLPKEDWPPGFPRDQRALQLSRMVHEDRAAVALAIQTSFRLTATQTAILIALLQNITVTRDRLAGLFVGMAPKTIDVHICNMRARLLPRHVAVTTLRGYGYQLSTDGRRLIMDTILPPTPQAA